MLAKAKLCWPKGATSYSAMLFQQSDYVGVRKHFKLIDSNVNERDPSDISYVLSGFAPLSVRLIQCLFCGKNIEKAAKLRNAPHRPMLECWKDAEPLYSNFPFSRIHKSQTQSDTSQNDPTDSADIEKRRNVFVAFLGGVTYAEVAALQLLGSFVDRNFIVCTTSMLNGDNLVSPALEHISFRGNQS